MSNKSTEMIGMDRCFRPVHVGDTVQDLHGERYAVTERGTCKGADGKEVNFSDIHAPELVLPADAAPGQPREAAAATEAQTKRHAYDEPKLGTPGRKAQREPQTAQETAENAAPVRPTRKKVEKPKTAAPAITRRVYRGRENKSGFVRLTIVARAAGYTLGHQTDVARAAGFEVVKDKNGQPCVKLEDRAAVEELLASAAAGEAGHVKADGRPAERIRPSWEAIKEKIDKKQKKGVVPPGVVKVPIKGFEDVLVHPVNPPKPAKLPAVEIRPLESVPVITAEEAAMLERLIQPVEIDLQPASDEALVAELRRRGWAVTCEKHITL